LQLNIKRVLTNNLHET